MPTCVWQVLLGHNPSFVLGLAPWSKPMQLRHAHKLPYPAGGSKLWVELQVRRLTYHTQLMGGLAGSSCRGPPGGS